jgi:hypothetical protein
MNKHYLLESALLSEDLLDHHAMRATTGFALKFLNKR